MRRKLRPLLLALGAVMVLAGFACLLFTKSKPAPPPPLPNPNGYDDFVSAGQMRTGQWVDYQTASEDEMRAYVMTNAAALAQVRIGLSRECRVPFDFALTNISGNLPELKTLAILLATEGRLAELENRPADAVHSYVDAIRLGNESSRGGFLIHRLVGLVPEGIGSIELVKLVPSLNCEQMRPLIADLEQVDAHGVTWEEVRQNERLYMHHQMRKSVNPLQWLVGWWQMRPAMRKAEAKHNRMVARRRLLTVELALRCYQQDQAGGPASLDQLVPKQLPRIPTDPFTGQPLIYRAQGTNWLLYSVGLDGVDDGGKPVGRTVSGTAATGDLFFDSPW